MPAMARLRRLLGRILGPAHDAGPVRSFVQVVFLTPREFQRDNGLSWAASLAYSSLLALVPVAILAFAMIEVFEQLARPDEKIVDLLIARGLPEAAEKAGDLVRELVAQARAASAQLGVTGIGLLLITGMNLFGAIERAVHVIWKAPPRRNPLSRFINFWLVLTLTPTLLGVSVYVTARVGSVEHRALVSLAPYATNCLVFFVLNLLLPNLRVRPVSALVGALVAGPLWEVGKLGFSYYVGRAVSFHVLYGPMSLVPVFVLWIWVTWIIVLLGVEIAYVHQNRAAVTIGAHVEGSGHAALREAQALGLIVEIHRAFRRGEKPPDWSTLSLRTAMPLEDVRLRLRELETAGYVRRYRGNTYLPAREGAQVRLADLAGAVRGGLPAEVADPVHRALLDVMRHAQESGLEVIGDTTVADLLSADGEAPSGPAEEVETDDER